MYCMYFIYTAVSVVEGEAEDVVKDVIRPTGGLESERLTEPKRLVLISLYGTALVPLSINSQHDDSTHQ